MRVSAGAILAVLASVTQAHYTFPGLIYNGVTEADWTYVRTTTNKYSHGPVQDVNDPQMACYEETPGQGAPNTMNVKAGDTVGFRVDGGIQHPGPLAFYMAKAPSGQTAASMSATDASWFKIYQDGATISGDSVTWKNDGKTSVSVTVPSCLAEGYYLLRAEHIGLHSAGSVGGAQFYMGCAQLYVTGGSGKTFSGVSIPGAYSPNDPGILFQLYWPIPTSYTNPGPAVVTC